MHAVFLTLASGIIAILIAPGALAEPAPSAVDDNCEFLRKTTRVHIQKLYAAPDQEKQKWRRSVENFQATMVVHSCSDIPEIGSAFPAKPVTAEEQERSRREAENACARMRNQLQPYFSAIRNPVEGESIKRTARRMSERIQAAMIIQGCADIPDIPGTAAAGSPPSEAELPGDVLDMLRERRKTDPQGADELERKLRDRMREEANQKRRRDAAEEQERARQRQAGPPSDPSLVVPELPGDILDMLRERRRTDPKGADALERDLRDKMREEAIKKRKREAGLMPPTGPVTPTGPTTTPPRTTTPTSAAPTTTAPASPAQGTAAPAGAIPARPAMSIWTAATAAC